MSTLHAFFDAVQANTAINFDSPEVKDITAAVEELLHRYTRKLNGSNDLFQISHIQPCGSMVEKTAVWRSIRRVENLSDMDEKYFEFDFLAVLEKSDEVSLKEVCPGCRTVAHRDETTSKTNLNKSVEMENTFHCELHKAIAALCNCFTSKYSNLEPSKIKTCSFLSSSDHGCMECTVYRKTGFLHIATGIDTSHAHTVDGVKCSFPLIWTSTTNSLVAPTTKTLQKTQVLKTLRIYIDLLPSFKVLHSNSGVQPDFIVAKTCCSCRSKDSWRFSNCLTEIDVMTKKISPYHRKCYTILKFLNELCGFSDSGYHLKTMVLKHCTKCTENNNYAKCIEDILGKLESTYVGSSLETFANKVRFGLANAAQFRNIEIIEAKLQIISNYLEFGESNNAVQFSVENCVSIIKDFEPSLGVPMPNLYSTVCTAKEFCMSSYESELREFKNWLDRQQE